MKLLLRLGTDPNINDRGQHPPLYCLANECASPPGPALVRMLVQAGANVNDSGGVTRDTPLQRALSCRHPQVAHLLRMSERS